VEIHLGRVLTTCNKPKEREREREREGLRFRRPRGNQLPSSLGFRV